MRLVTRKDNPLFPPYESFPRKVRVGELADLMTPLELARMALDAGTIGLIWTLLKRDAPNMIVEFGSGASTLVFARFASLMSAAGKECGVLSIEQSAEFKERTDAWLRRAGLETVARIVHVPLDADSNYEGTALARTLGSLQRPADFVLIDGPFGPRGCRVGTLPSLVHYACDGARWVLDDAFRDGEIAILRRWSSASGITVSGVYPISKGLATGFLKSRSTRGNTKTQNELTPRTASSKRQVPQVAKVAVPCLGGEDLDTRDGVYGHLPKIHLSCVVEIDSEEVKPSTKGLRTCDQFVRTNLQTRLDALWKLADGGRTGS